MLTPDWVAVTSARHDTGDLAQNLKNHSRACQQHDMLFTAPPSIMVIPPEPVVAKGNTLQTRTAGETARHPTRHLQKTWRGHFRLGSAQFIDSQCQQGSGTG